MLCVAPQQTIILVINLSIILTTNQADKNLPHSADFPFE